MINLPKEERLGEPNDDVVMMDETKRLLNVEPGITIGSEHGRKLSFKGRGKKCFCYFKMHWVLCKSIFSTRVCALASPLERRS